MDQVIMFDKSFQQRKREYEEVLAGFDVLPVSAIEKEWAFYLELTLDAVGWQAIWRIQRQTCETLGIPYPSVVLVFVVNVDYHELTALVKILAVQDEDIHLQKQHHVPLVHLWPTKDQDDSIALNLEASANVLDMLRFFFNNLLMPWDFEDDDTSDWRTKHLEPRLRLYYDMKNGIISTHTSEYILSLIAEAKRLQTKRKYLESDLGDEDPVESDTNTQSLIKIHIRLMEIKGEIDILENPFLRGALINKRKKSAPIDDSTQNIWLIYDKGTVTDYITFLNTISQQFPTETLQFSPNLATTLENSNSKDIFILNEASHTITSTGSLEYGGILKGISNKEKHILVSETEDLMLTFKDNVVLENITIEAKTPQCAILVRSGELTLNNCKLIGDGKSSTHQGIIVLAGASLIIRDSEICNFYTAIVGNSGANISIENSEIYDCNFGLQLFDNSTLIAVKTIIRNCKDYGICVESENINDESSKTGNFESLSIMPKIHVESLKGNDNLKGNAVINKKSKLKPVKDLFEDPNADITVCIGSDEEEMDVNTTLQN